MMIPTTMRNLFRVFMGAVPGNPLKSTGPVLSAETLFFKREK